VPTIDLVNVNRFYGAVHVCKGINLSIADREFVTLLGSSGCGKTTTLNMIAGLDEASSGDIMMNGRRVNHLEPVERDVAMVFQNYSLYPHMTVAENIGFNLKLKGIAAAEINKRVVTAAESLDLGQLLDRYPSQLSGGQQQRVAIGRAIVRKPQVFLFDEPFSNLDAALRKRMRAEVRELHAQLGVTSVFVTHDQEEALSISDRIAIMRDGVVEQFGTPEEVYTQPATSSVARFIGSPQIELMAGTVTMGDGCVTLSIAGTDIPISDSQARFVSGQDVEVGIRPEHVRLSDKGHPARVELVQPVGPSTHVSLNWAGGKLVTSMPGFVRLRAGTATHFDFDPQHLLIFDKKNGRRL